MDRIQNQTLSLVTGTTLTSQVFVDRYDQIQFFVPAMTGVMGSGVVYATLLGAPVSGVTSKVMSFYDYINKTPATSVITISTAGYYEVPFAGAANYVQIQLDVAATGPTTCYLTTPKITY